MYHALNIIYIVLNVILLKTKEQGLVAPLSSMRLCALGLF